PLGFERACPSESAERAPSSGRALGVSAFPSLHRGFRGQSGFRACRCSRIVHARLDQRSDLSRRLFEILRCAKRAQHPIDGMNRAECERLIADYLRWLKEGLQVSELQGSCCIATPFVDRHNDEIEIYVEKRNGGLLLTDDGYTIADLASSGMAFSTDKRKAHLMAILNGFGVRQEGDELQVHASPQDFPQKKHNL